MNDFDWDKLLSDCVDFSRRLIQTPSMTYEEGDLARLVMQELQRNGIDEVWMDEIGNVSGRIRGKDCKLGALVLNSHLDHVDPGNLELWSVPPFAAEIQDGNILGRGACDIKGPLAVQVYSMVALLRKEERPKRDVVFSGVVQEEIGGAGAVYWASNLDYEVGLIVLGEPSSNQISLGHRGIMQMWITFYGRSRHASVAESAGNPNYVLAQFLNRLHQKRDSLRSHPILGKTTVSPTILEVDTKSMNVTPAWSRVLLDFRTAAESPKSLNTFISEVAGEAHYEISDAWADEPNTPIVESDQIIYGYLTAPESQSVKFALTALTLGLGWEPKFTSYQFATDGRHFVSLDVPIIGFSAGEEKFAHTVDERIAINMMADSLRGHVQLLLDY